MRQQAISSCLPRAGAVQLLGREKEIEGITFVNWQAKANDANARERENEQKYNSNGAPIGDTVGTNVVWEDGESDINVLLDFGGGPSFIRQPYFDTRRTVGVFGEVEHTIAEAIFLGAAGRAPTAGRRWPCSGG